MRTFAEKPKTTQPTTSAKSTALSRAHFGQGRDPNSILNLQRTIGNQAVQEALIKSTGGSHRRFNRHKNYAFRSRF